MTRTDMTLEQSDDGGRGSAASALSSSGSRSTGSGASGSGAVTGSSSSSGTCGTCSTDTDSGTGSSASGDTSTATASDSRSGSNATPEETAGEAQALYTLQEDAEDGSKASGDEGREDGGRPVSPSPSSWSGSEAGWDEDKRAGRLVETGVRTPSRLQLQMAEHFDAQRRLNTTAGWQARQQKYPELFRSDVTICPSYSQFQVPYWAVCRRRSGRALRRISRRLAQDVEELALLQTRALDGVRVVRCFSLGARPGPGPGRAPDPLTPRQRRRSCFLLEHQQGDSGARSESERSLACADGRSVPSPTQCFTGK
ncbi:RNA polymerase-associated protein CTR9-like protein [Frankliniella fusca]|uniref:RNA polymerase-associated protein CTR9-like protein n=1 Tax=Frankliniella fusca TaxID=407009 RepID=A0AAE1LK23_9NEOP|nr:RNA polymerase-associated protein CTR9-like protein [Frankliniella fusca]